MPMTTAPLPGKVQSALHTLRSYNYKRLVFLVFATCLAFGTFLVPGILQPAHAADSTTGCAWYTVRGGDTLTGIASKNHTTVSALTRANHLQNANLIFKGQRLCIPQKSSASTPPPVPPSTIKNGILADGTVRWYAYDALDTSTRPQVETLLRQAAAQYKLPANLLLAIAWQESGWYQHVIAKDGGIGVMQLMPYTAMSLNTETGIRRDPYHLQDNINLGATYLQNLWNHFHGDVQKVASAYNEGGWAVDHYGIFNWAYVNSVLSLMKQFH